MQDGGARPTQRSWTVYLQTEERDGKKLKNTITKEESKHCNSVRRRRRRQRKRRKRREKVF